MADKKRTILFPEPAKSLSFEGLFKKIRQAISQNIRTERHGFEGDIASFKRSNLPPTTIGWEFAYKRGAGKRLKSKVLEGKTFSLPGKGKFKKRTRSKCGPRFNIEVKF